MAAWNRRARLATVATAVALILLAGRLLPTGSERPSRAGQASHVAGTARPRSLSE